MTRQKIFVVVVVLALFAVTAGVLRRYQSIQRLGPPGVKTQPIPGSSNLLVVLPEQVLNCKSRVMEQAQIVLDILPKDTSFGQRIYEAPDGDFLQLNVVLMGADRTSLHKPQICMPGSGLQIEKTEVVSVPVSEPHPYELPVIKLTVSKPSTDGQTPDLHALYVYWYVAGDAVSADPSALRRMVLSSRNLLLKGEMQRWAYVTCFTQFAAGQEEACFDRMKKFLADAVPQFHLYTP